MELIDIIPEFNLYEEYWKIYTKSDIIPPQFISEQSKIERSIIGEAPRYTAKSLTRSSGQALRSEKVR